MSAFHREAVLLLVDTNEVQELGGDQLSCAHCMNSWAAESTDSGQPEETPRTFWLPGLCSHLDEKTHQRHCPRSNELTQLMAASTQLADSDATSVAIEKAASRQAGSSKAVSKTAAEWNGSGRKFRQDSSDDEEDKAVHVKNGAV